MDIESKTPEKTAKLELPLLSEYIIHQTVLTAQSLVLHSIQQISRSTSHTPKWLLNPIFKHGSVCRTQGRVHSG